MGNKPSNKARSIKLNPKTKEEVSRMTIWIMCDKVGKNALKDLSHTYIKLVVFTKEFCSREDKTPKIIKKIKKEHEKDPETQQLDSLYFEEIRSQYIGYQPFIYFFELIGEKDDFRNTTLFKNAEEEYSRGEYAKCSFFKFFEEDLKLKDFYDVNDFLNNLRDSIVTEMKNNDEKLFCEDEAPKTFNRNCQKFCDIFISLMLGFTENYCQKLLSTQKYNFSETDKKIIQDLQVEFKPLFKRDEKGSELHFGVKLSNELSQYLSIDCPKSWKKNELKTFNEQYGKENNIHNYIYYREFGEFSPYLSLQTYQNVKHRKSFKRVFKGIFGKKTIKKKPAVFPPLMKTFWTYFYDDSDVKFVSGVFEAMESMDCYESDDDLTFEVYEE